MSWTCPLCDRLFAHRDQQHSCKPSNIARVLDGLNEAHVRIVQRLLEIVRGLPGVKVEGASGSLMVKAPATFVSIRPRSKDVQVSFKLDEEITGFPITKSLRLSAHRVAHAVHIDEVADVNAQLERWIRRAYDLAAARNVGGRGDARKKGSSRPIHHPSRTIGTRRTKDR